MSLSVSGAFRRILLDKRASSKDRVRALKSMPRPSIRLLQLLLADDLPPKLRVSVTEAYEKALSQRPEVRPANPDPTLEPVQTDDKPEPAKIKAKRALSPQELKDLLG